MNKLIYRELPSSLAKLWQKLTEGFDDRHKLAGMNGLVNSKEISGVRPSREMMAETKHRWSISLVYAGFRIALIPIGKASNL